jgi:hypothetical protein
MVYAQGSDGIEILRTQMIWMTFQVDIASHVERSKYMLEYIGQAVMKHGCWCPAANIEGCYRLITNQAGVEVDLGLNGFCVPGGHNRMINFLVVWAIRAYSLAKRDVKIDSQFLEFPEVCFERGHPLFECDFFLLGQYVLQM